MAGRPEDETMKKIMNKPSNAVGGQLSHAKPTSRPPKAEERKGLPKRESCRIHGLGCPHGIHKGRNDSPVFRLRPTESPHDCRVPEREVFPAIRTTTELSGKPSLKQIESRRRYRAKPEVIARNKERNRWYRCIGNSRGGRAKYIKAVNLLGFLPEYALRILEMG